jgi:hypothetical protein
LEGVNPPPICQAILLCDDVTREDATSKTTVSGIFDTFYVPSFPGTTVPCKVFLRLTGVVGKCNLVAEIQDPVQGVVLLRSPHSAELAAEAEQTKGEIALPVSPLPFARPGTYELVVFADRIEVARVQFDVKTVGVLSHVSGQHA